MNTLPPHALNGNIPHFVYELVDPRDMLAFYVGITVDLYDRYRKHMTCNGSNPQKDQRIQEILVAGHLPIMRTLEQVSSLASALERESYWIHHYLSIGVLLLNQQIPSSAQDINPQKTRKSDVRCGRKFKDAQIKEIIMYRLKQGSFPADLSEDMQSYYHVHYIKRDGKYRAKTREWRAELREQKSEGV